MSKVQLLHKKGLINPESYVLDTQYEVITGSLAYGVSSDNSDMDIYGFCIPPKNLVFPHLAGEIVGFGRQKQRFEQWQQHHVIYEGVNHDLSVYSIVRYFTLCMENNPNMIDSLFVPDNCVLHITKIGHIVRTERYIFLHKGAWYKFKGYAYSQMHKIDTKNPEGKRKDIIDEFGYDVKFAYHVVRLLNEVEQILIEGDLDLQRNREQLKSIRRGEWELDDIKDYFNKKEKELETLYIQSRLRIKPDEEKIKQLLLSCLEEYYGSIPLIIEQDYKLALYKIKEIASKF